MRDDCSRWRIALKERDDDYNRGQREASPIGGSGNQFPFAII